MNGQNQPILCTACFINQDKTDTEKESLKSIASDGIELIQDIPCCPLVTDSEKFTPVLEDQSFQFGIDYNTNMDTYYGLAKTPDNFYLSYGGYLYYADGDMNSYGLFAESQIAIIQQPLFVMQRCLMAAAWLFMTMHSIH